MRSVGLREGGAGRFVSLDGRIVPAARAVVPAGDPALRYGLGLFETLRAYGGVPFRLADHLARLGASARRFAIDVDPARDVAWFERRIAALVDRNALADAAIRITLTGGGTLLIETTAIRERPRSWYAKGAGVVLAGFVRDPAAPLSGHKTVSYLENMVAHLEAVKAKAADCILVAPDGRVLEGCVSNVFLVEEGCVVTPSLDCGVLPGVTRQVVLDLARRAGFPTEECRVEVARLAAAGELFLTGSLMEVLPVTRLGDQILGRVGPVVRALRRAYRAEVARCCRTPG